PAADGLAVADSWFDENGGRGDADKEYERTIIRLAVGNAERLRLFGGVLYAEGRPAAMTLASAITKDTADIHFEKAAAPYARDGAYAVINKEFAASLAQFRHINREEDMGLEGLRKAKLSYYPDILLEKFRAERR
ncbi:MAG: phosphatidylglycerol lysyltransferase domain-containing protein, partial [Treponemataceae bacterium]|nr:phosphatidylglycerol lysyltransferase domain-containing protein [Treponemataceae bacterium]